jgi:ABC-type nitrate/sulfonate/bicarbonate transport system permease component
MATSGTVTEQAAVSLFAARRSVRSPQSSVLRFARRNPLGAVAAIVILTLVVSAVFAPLVAPYDPYFPDPINRLAAPSGQHLFGTDDIGRDVFSRVVYGGRISLQVGLLTVLLGTVVGATIGLVSAYWSGWADIVVQRLLDSLQSIPGLLLALVVASVIGAGTINTIFPIALILIPINARVVRSAVLSVREHQYIEAAHVLGCSHRRITRRLTGRIAPADHAAPHPAERGRADPDPGLDLHRQRDHRRGVAQLPRPGYGAADTVLGEHAQRSGPGLHGAGALAGDLPRPGDHGDRALLQPARRRPARHLGPPPARAIR